MITGPSIQGSGVVITETRDVPVFHSIRSSGSMDVEVTLGEVQSVEVIADDNLVDLFTTEVKNGQLLIGTKSNTNYSTRSDIKINVVAREIQSLKVNGSGSIKASNIDSDAFSASVNGSGDIFANGSAAKVDVSVTGSGEVDLAQVQAETVSVQVTGSGDVDVNCTQKLSAKITGSGDIRYASHPDLKIEKRVVGSGDIEAR